MCVYVNSGKLSFKISTLWMARTRKKIYYYKTLLQNNVIMNTSTKRIIRF